MALDQSKSFLPSVVEPKKVQEAIDKFNDLAKKQDELAAEIANLTGALKATASTAADVLNSNLAGLEQSLHAATEKAYNDAMDHVDASITTELRKRDNRIAKLEDNEHVTTELQRLEDLIGGSLTYAGQYENDTTYAPNTVVMYLEHTFIARRRTSAKPTQPNQDDWAPFLAGGGSGGGFSTIATERANEPVQNPLDSFIYGRRGGSYNAWFRSERLWEEFAPNTQYWIGEKMYVTDPVIPDAIYIYECLTTHISRPTFDAVEQLEWKIIASSRNLAPISYADAPPIPTLEGYFWIKTDTWEIHTSYYDAGGDLRWINTGMKGSRPAGSGGSGNLPPSNPADRGEALVVDASGNPAWAAPITSTDQDIDGGVI